MAREDLIPMSNRSKEEVKKLGAKGGRASGKSRRKKKKMREWAETFRDIPFEVTLPDGKKVKTTMAGAVVFQQLHKAINRSDTKAAKFIALLLGELETNINITDKTPQVIVQDQKTADDLRDIIDLENEE